MEQFIAYWHTLQGKAVVIGAACCLLLLGYLIAVALWIHRRKRVMKDYGSFVWESYVRQGEPVPAIIRRYYCREIDRYNRARNRRFFRWFWPRAAEDYGSLPSKKAQAPAARQKDMQP